MIKIDFDTSNVLDNILTNLKKKYIPVSDKVNRVIATSLLATVHYRIHIEGKDSSDNEIGTYSDTYLKYRIKENRTSDSKVILSLTRQMEQDFSVVAGENGSYGLGYKNKINFDKAEWLEEKYFKTIFSLTEQEKKLIPKIIETEINK
jgi:hypothetical protein